MCSLGIECRAKALLPNSATSKHSLTSNSVVQDILPRKTYTGRHTVRGLVYNSSNRSSQYYQIVFSST